MKDIIKPIPKKVLSSEIKKIKNKSFLRKSNKGNYEIYDLDIKDSIPILLEIGRLREEAFRERGGTGKEIDLSIHDIREKNPYNQLIAYDSKNQEIVGGYCYIICDKVKDNLEENLASSQLFEYSKRFKEEYLIHSAELRRAFVAKNKQASREGLFVLDALWDALGTIPIENPEVKFLNGKITIYKTIDENLEDSNKDERDMIVSFLRSNLNYDKNLIRPKKGLEVYVDSKFSKHFKGHIETDKKYLRSIGIELPTLAHQYANLTNKSIIMQTATNTSFGNVEETGLIVPIYSINQKKSERHIISYAKEKGKKNEFLKRFDWYKDQ